MNALYPERFSEREVERIAAAVDGADELVRPALTAAVDEARRTESQGEQLRRLGELTRTDIKTLPFVFAPELGVAELEQLADSI
jgi:hypothetical protein